MILHVDMDAYYASVEERDRPELRGQPVVVGGSAERRGVVSAANYEARKFGVRSAMPMVVALRRCPTAVVLPVRMEHYAAISRQIRSVFQRYTPLVEPLSLDEAFLDVTGCESLFGSPIEIARKIKDDIVAETALIASVGVAPNKFLAKVASDLEKPDGFVVVTPDQVQAFLDPLPVSRLWGIGNASERRLEKIGIETVGQLRLLTPDILLEHFGETGRRLWDLAHGRDARAVVPDREARSISHETTFAVDIRDREIVRDCLLELTEQVARRLRRCELRARTISLKVRFEDFRTITRSRSVPQPTNSTNELWEVAAELLDRVAAGSIRLVGVGVSNIDRGAQRQQGLFEEDRAQQERLDTATDAIRERFGNAALHRGTRLRRSRNDDQS